MTGKSCLIQLLVSWTGLVGVVVQSPGLLAGDITAEGLGLDPIHQDEDTVAGYIVSAEIIPSD